MRLELRTQAEVPLATVPSPTPYSNRAVLVTGHIGAIVLHPIKTIRSRECRDGRRRYVRGLLRHQQRSVDGPQIQVHARHGGDLARLVIDTNERDRKLVALAVIDDQLTNES